MGWGAFRTTLNATLTEIPNHLESWGNPDLSTVDTFRSLTPSPPPATIPQ